MPLEAVHKFHNAQGGVELRRALRYFVFMFCRIGTYITKALEGRKGAVKNAEKVRYVIYKCSLNVPKVASSVDRFES